MASNKRLVKFRSGPLKGEFRFVSQSGCAKGPSEPDEHPDNPDYVAPPAAPREPTETSDASELSCADRQLQAAQKAQIKTLQEVQRVQRRDELVAISQSRDIGTLASVPLLVVTLAAIAVTMPPLLLPAVTGLVLSALHKEATP